MRFPFQEPIDWPGKLAAYNEERGRNNQTRAADFKEMLRTMYEEYHTVDNCAYILKIHPNTLHAYRLKLGLRKKRQRSNRAHPMKIDKILRLHRKGFSAKAIAKEVQLCWLTVRKYILEAL